MSFHLELGGPLGPVTIPPQKSARKKKGEVFSHKPEKDLVFKLQEFE